MQFLNETSTTIQAENFQGLHDRSQTINSTLRRKSKVLELYDATREMNIKARYELYSYRLNDRLIKTKAPFFGTNVLFFNKMWNTKLFC
mgnify:CR=1 FL=1